MLISGLPPSFVLSLCGPTLALLVPPSQLTGDQQGLNRTKTGTWGKCSLFLAVSAVPLSGVFLYLM